ncbi:MAG TPA: hypothetical protein LFV91_07085 [Rickettsia endosymbiont of Bembidion nr. Transversale]|nr:hypothetical protein [Rickettsia endosymbiont of Bembidion nr. Transversale]
MTYSTLPPCKDLSEISYMRSSLIQNSNTKPQEKELNKQSQTIDFDK